MKRILPYILFIIIYSTINLYANSTLRDWFFNLPYRDGQYRMYTSTTTYNYLYEESGSLKYTGTISISSGTYTNLSAEKITNPVSSTQIIYSTNTISIDSLYTVIASTGGAVTLTSDPQIEAGTVGDIIEIWGSSDTNTITLIDGNGLKLNSGTSFALGLDDVLSLRYTSSNVWSEKYRSDN